MTRVSGCFLSVLLGLTAASTCLADWNLADQFDPSNNPTGAWSYGYTETLGEFTAFGWHGTDPNYNWPIWSTGPDYNGGEPHFYLNNQGGTYLGIPPGEACLHPSSDVYMSVVRWTSPIAQDISVQGAFGEGNIGIVSVLVAKTLAGGGTSVLLSQYSTASAVPFDISTSVQVGDCIDLAVDSDGIWFADSTPISVTIVPEPTCVALLAAGALGLLRPGRR